MKRVIVLPTFDPVSGKFSGRYMVEVPECCVHLLTEKDFQ